MEIEDIERVIGDDRHLLIRRNHHYMLMDWTTRKPVYRTVLPPVDYPPDVPAAGFSRPLRMFGWTLALDAAIIAAVAGMVWGLTKLLR